ncbi:MAG: alanine racemase [Oscillospiraceae bacterium]|nr:alanine racemase [Oscillospiraceae bacterium]
MNEQEKRTWAEVHLERLAHNYRTIRAALPQGCRFMGLIKANAYGHGMTAVAHKLESLGADYLAVACLDEAEELRQNGIALPILILGYTPAAYAGDLLRYDITQTIYDPEQAREFAAAAQKAGRPLKVHLKADTGMSRLGFLCDEAHINAGVEAMAEAAALPGLIVEGLFTHFADADSCEEYSLMQLRRFEEVRTRLADRGIKPALCHCTASAATLNYGQGHLDLVRPGILLYGHHPHPSTVPRMELQPVMELKSRVASVRALPKGSCVSYGRTYTLERDSLVAVVPIGYADGLFRALSSRTDMLVRGKRAPQIGRVCMDLCMLDVTDIPGVQTGDVVTVFGTGLPLEEKAEAAGTISYELLCAVSPRVPRVYFDEG